MFDYENLCYDKWFSCCFLMFWKMLIYWGKLNEWFLFRVIDKDLISLL